MRHAKFCADRSMVSEDRMIHDNAILQKCTIIPMKHHESLRVNCGKIVR